MTGPPTETLDFSMFKEFSLTERFHFQIRAKALNIFKTPVLSQPDLSLGDSKAYGGNGLFGVITSSVASTERHLQLSMRLWF